jgi:hypothetical protein
LIIVIEATKPHSQIENYSAWEGILLDKNYHFVYFDGLNRFYVHNDHIELAEHFKFPINVFDNFMLSGKASHTFHKLFTSKAKESEAKAKESEAKAKAIYNSRSWRITAPIRIACQKARIFLRTTKTINSVIKTKIKLLLADIRLYVIQSPRLRSYVTAVLPELLTLRMRQSKLPTAQMFNPSATNKLTKLKPRARQIYKDLIIAIESRSRE